MTIEQFNKFKFRKDNIVLYNGFWHRVIAVDFEKNSVGISMHEDDDDLTWIGCEDFEIV
jgi:hypothetical protein